MILFLGPLVRRFGLAAQDADAADDGAQDRVARRAILVGQPRGMANTRVPRGLPGTMGRDGPVAPRSMRARCRSASPGRAPTQ